MAYFTELYSSDDRSDDILYLLHCARTHVIHGDLSLGQIAIDEASTMYAESDTSKWNSLSAKSYVDFMFTKTNKAMLAGTERIKP